MHKSAQSLVGSSIRPALHRIPQRCRIAPPLSHWNAEAGPSSRQQLRVSSRAASQVAAAATGSKAEESPADPVDVEYLKRSKLVGQGKSPFPSTHVDPKTRYLQLIESGILNEDPDQNRIIDRIQRLYNELEHYKPPEIPAHKAGSGGFMTGLFGARSSTKGTVPLESVPKGLYLYGDVGTGKTMLMDLFYDCIPSHLSAISRRVHFHAFMIDVFHRVHAVKLGLSSSDHPLTAGKPARITTGYDTRSADGLVGVDKLSGGGLFSFFGANKARAMAEEDAIYEVARELALEGRVLCFDEFQVTDIVTAMILRQLLERMMAYGVVCVMTSNRHPDDLYKNGIQRSSFEPCIELIKQRFDVVDLDSGTDYRKIPKALSKVYFSPLNSATRMEMSKLFEGFASVDPYDPVVEGRKLKVWGRDIRVPESTHKVAKFSFHDLCGQPLSSADYLEITKKFGTIFVEEVGRMGMDQKDYARRFITFIDACYESRTRLFISSEVSIFKIFSEEDHGSQPAGKISDHMRSIMDDLGLGADEVGSSSMFTGQEELFAFARCVSRLVQMGTKEWTSTAGQG